MLKTIFSSIRMLLALSVLTGIMYPLAITLFAQVAFPAAANGSLIYVNQIPVGSSLIGQNMNENKRYFWSRPSATNYNPFPSGASNLSPINTILKEATLKRDASFRAANNVPNNVGLPSDIRFASGSGLDPHISPEAAYLQISRISAERGVDQTKLRDLINQHIEKPQLGFLGQPRVNVLMLNMALDTLKP